jgi:Type VI secretion system (T6SS), amidase effector protein 4
MGARKPGPLCVTSAERRDSGTACLHRTDPPGPNRHKAEPKPPELSFDKLWQGYPSSKPYVDKSGDPPKGFENQCAIKVSVALHAAGVDMKSFKGAAVSVDDKRLAIRAEELAAWLKTQHLIGLPLKPENVTGKEWQDKIKGRKGIVFFANYWPRDGETRPTGDHIDLWNGWRLTASGLEGLAVTFMRFGLGRESGYLFKNLGDASTILFWEIR